MARRYLPPEVHQLPDGTTVRPLEDRAWQVVLQIADAVSDGRTLDRHEIARRCGITTDHASRILVGLSAVYGQSREPVPRERHSRNGIKL